MDFFDALNMLGGLCLFLLGMNLMSTNLELCAGKRMSGLLVKATGTPLRGFLLGFLVTLVIQSSSATTVMVVGFVSAGMMTLQQSVGVIIGANLGTTITSWMIALTGLESDLFWLQMIKPSSFSPILALIGVVLITAGKKRRRKEIGMVLLGFTVLIFGIETMSGAVSGLRESPAFGNLLIAFSSPIMGILLGTALTAIIQSSSASIGILQALCATGQITYGLSVPLLLGQNFGACVTAMIASIGAPRDAKRAALIHLYFNLIGKSLAVGIFYLLNVFLKFPFLNDTADAFGIAMVHTAINLAAALLLLPFSKLLIKLTKLTVRDSAQPTRFQKLDERLLSTPAIALSNCEEVVGEMASLSIEAIQESLQAFDAYSDELADRIREKEHLADQYEDHIGSYLIKISGHHQLSERESSEATKLLRVIGDFERISDHAVNLLESVEEIREKKIKFTPDADAELRVLCSAVSEILLLAKDAFRENDLAAAQDVEPLEQVIDGLRQKVRKNHTLRLQKNECTIEHGFVLSDILTNLERVADHCSNIAGCILESQHAELDMHRYLSDVRTESEEFRQRYREYRQKYSI
ncbi:MAG: Na/Pi cotransporter family protein [Oscillospiraceae bacterium]|nr:Na/Pi cotransporter family protein [Oscillospiraceae bacterium]